jgi:hypothetical protein
MILKILLTGVKLIMISENEAFELIRDTMLNKPNQVVFVIISHHRMLSTYRSNIMEKLQPYDEYIDKCTVDCIRLKNGSRVYIKSASMNKHTFRGMRISLVIFMIYDPRVDIDELLYEINAMMAPYSNNNNIYFTYPPR